MLKRTTLCLVLTLLLAAVGCSNDNEHFCARYDYVYTQLDTEQDLPSYSEMKQSLLKEINERPGDHDKASFMLFVLEDFQVERKPLAQTPREFCMSEQSWQRY